MHLCRKTDCDQLLASLCHSEAAPAAGTPFLLQGLWGHPAHGLRPVLAQLSWAVLTCTLLCFPLCGAGAPRVSWSRAGLGTTAARARAAHCSGEGPVLGVHRVVSVHPMARIGPRGRCTPHGQY